MGSGRARLARALHGLTKVDTTGRGGCHGQPVVAATAVVSTFLPGCLFSFSAFHFPKPFLGFVLRFFGFVDLSGYIGG